MDSLLFNVSLKAAILQQCHQSWYQGSDPKIDLVWVSTSDKLTCLHSTTAPLSTVLDIAGNL